MTSWDRSFAALVGQETAERFCRAVPPGYRHVTPPALAAEDLSQIQRLLREGGEAVNLWPGDDKEPPCLRFYSIRGRYLDECLPPLRHLGLRVRDQSHFVFRFPEGTVHIRCFRVESSQGREALLAAADEIVALLQALMAGQVEDDALNGLVLKAGLSWRFIDVLRAYRNYFFQLGQPYGPARFHQVLLEHAEVVALLMEYFRTRFDPAQSWPSQEAREEEGLLPLRLKLQRALEPIADLDADRILRTLFNLIDATVRTNFYRPGARDRFAFKLSGLGVIGMPVPKPLFETYVHTATMEAVHLRGGRIARGGIRWSDRPDDFRTEIWELMRTQMLKNALIVPQGAKGGFVIKGDDVAVEQAYVTFMRALLDLTDNLEAGRVVHPPGVLCYDDDDYYLVVAADKGTAHLSDAANRVAAEYRFWLGDAFASGGSHGYDHKKLGITAKGAWECARRHFYELGRDLDKEVVTVIGIGSMRGDVFGNGMLLSPKIKLLAAFSGSHIFLDPEPDPEISFRERRRLFEAEACWEAYDPERISPGGGVWPRRAKRIPLSPQVRRWLGVRHHSLDGETLIRHILTAEADLMWLGGIGTYVKASDERNEWVGDPGNDGVRVDANQLRVRVVAEGANLGFTQRGRIEFALQGGKINMDAIDNSGGVDLSDHEVNYKILLHQVAGTGLSAEQVSDRLHRLAGDTVARVLTHNRSQSLCLSLDLLRCRQNPLPFLELADRLENAGLLNRTAESFPARDQVLARPGQSLTRPELAVLLAMAKMQFKQGLQARPRFLEQKFLHAFLHGYFPAELEIELGERIDQHPLAREITATTAANYLIDRAGVTFLTWIEELGPLLEQAVANWLSFDAVLAAEPMRRDLQNLPLASERCYQLLLRLENALADCCRWFLERGRYLAPEAATVEQCQNYLHCYLNQFVDVDDKEVARLEAEGLAPAQAARLAAYVGMEEFAVLLDLTLAGRQEFAVVARSFRSVARFLGLSKLLSALGSVSVRSVWDSRLKQALRQRLWAAMATLTHHFLQLGEGDVGVVCTHPVCLQRFSRYQRLQRELERSPSNDLLPFATLAAELEGMVEALQLRQT